MQAGMRAVENWAYTLEDTVYFCIQCYILRSSFYILASFYLSNVGLDVARVWNLTLSH